VLAGRQRKDWEIHPKSSLAHMLPQGAQDFVGLFSQCESEVTTFSAHV